MDIKDVKIFPVEGNKVIKANGSFVAGSLRVKFAIMQGSNGLFVSLPSIKYQKDGEDKWDKKVECTSKEESESLNEQLLAAFSGGKTTTSTEATTSSQAVNKPKAKNLPF